jgi:hypothetical protein
MSKQKEVIIPLSELPLRIIIIEDRAPSDVLYNGTLGFDDNGHFDYWGEKDPSQEAFDKLVKPKLNDLLSPIFEDEKPEKSHA